MSKKKFLDDFVSPGPIPELMAMKLTGGTPETDKLTPEAEEIQRKRRSKMGVLPVDTRPIIEDGKTLDELATSAYEKRLTAAMRAEGFSDEEIWATMQAF